MQPFSQFDTSGRLRHLITLDGLSNEQVRSILERAQSYLAPRGSAPIRSRALDGITIGNIFNEPSTRTRSSFELAGRRLGAGSNHQG